MSEKQAASLGNLAAVVSSKRVTGYSQDSVSAKKESYAMERAMLMYGCYRKDEAANPEVFLTAASAILADYPEDVIQYVTDPRTGIPGKLKWPPQPSEVKEACVVRYNEIQTIERRIREGKAQIARLNEYERLAQERQTRPTVDDLKAKYGGDNWGIESAKRERPVVSAEASGYTQRCIEREYAELGIEPITAGGIVLSPTLVRQIKSKDDQENAA